MSKRQFLLYLVLHLAFLVLAGDFVLMATGFIPSTIWQPFSEPILWVILIMLAMDLPVFSYTTGVGPCSADVKRIATRGQSARNERRKQEVQAMLHEMGISRERAMEIGLPILPPDEMQARPDQRQSISTVEDKGDVFQHVRERPLFWTLVLLIVSILALLMIYADEAMKRPRWFHFVEFSVVIIIVLALTWHFFIV